ncbi:phosphomevalonate kinase, partial [Klebsiella oxytoca]
AGNGDCGIVIADEKTDIEEMKNNWRKNGIMPLNFLVHSIA